MFSYACLSLSQARSSERNRVTRSAPTYFRQTYGLLSNRDVRTVCSCQPSYFSTESRGIVSGAERDEANERPGTPARRPRFHFHYEAGAKRFAYAHSLSFVRTYVRMYVLTRRDLRMRRVHAYLTPYECFIFYHGLVIARKNRNRRRRAPGKNPSRAESFSRICI